MSQTYFAILTAVGEAKLANAAALGTQLQISRMAVGDGNGSLPTPNPTQTALINERYRADLNELKVDPNNSNQIIAELVIPEAEGGWWIREMGLLDAAGDLIAVSNCPPSYKPQMTEGSGRTQVLRMVLIVSSTAAVQLKIDPSVVLATRAYVDSVTVRASQAEAETGAENSKIMTSLRVFQAIRSAAASATESLRGTLRIGTQAEIDAGESAAVAVTPLTLMKGAGIHRRAVFFESGTWLCPPGVTRIHVTGCGGGGGGGGPASGGSSYGQGGGSGASAICVPLDVIPGMEYIVSIGAAGNGGGPGVNGSAGGATSFASLLTLGGGAGGLSAGSGSGGGGGAPFPEYPGTARGANGADSLAGGHGGSSVFGGGGSARSSAGSAGAGWGGGGAAGRAGTAGGNGASGFLIVEW